jgi:hypothetical protein
MSAADFTARRVAGSTAVRVDSTVVVAAVDTPGADIGKIRKSTPSSHAVKTARQRTKLPAVSFVHVTF